MSTIEIRGTDGRDRMWPFSNSSKTMQALEAGYRFSIDARRQIDGQRAQLAGTGKFTRDGVAAEVKRFATEMLPNVAKGRLALKRARDQVQGRRERIKPAVPDPQNTVAFFKRESIRDE